MNLRREHMFKFKKVLVLLLVFVMVMALISGCKANDTDDATTEGVSSSEKENAVAVVGDKVIDIATFNIYFQMYETAYKQYYGEEILTQEFEGVKFGDVLRTDILDMLVQDELIHLHVLSNGFTIPQDVFDTKYAELNEMLEADAETKALYDTIGVTEDFLKKQVEGSIILEEFSTEIYEIVDADEAALNTIYANDVVRVRARHILVEDEATAIEVKGKLDAGEDFAELATEYSVDTGSAANGGDLDYFTKGDMVSEFEEVAFNAPIGSVSDIVQSNYGFHIIKVEDAQTVNQMVDAGVEEAIVNSFKESVRDTLFADAYKAKVDEIKAANTVETFIEKVTPKTEE